MAYAKIYAERRKIAITDTEAGTIYGSLVPANAIDDNTATMYHANGANPWFQAHFDLASVSDVEVLNRRDCCRDRLENTVISLWRDGTKVLDCGTITNVNVTSIEEADQTYTVNCGGELGDAVKMNGQDDIMNFAEIRVYTPVYTGRSNSISLS